MEDTGQSKAKLYVVLVNYNSAKWIDRTLESLLSSDMDLTLVAIDNCSTDDSIKRLEDYPGLVLIRNKENLGFGKAANQGLRLALENNADYAFLLNQDLYLQKDSLSKLVRIADTNPDFGVIAPLQTNGNGSRLDRRFINYLANQRCGLLDDLLIPNQLKEIYEVNFVNAAAWLIPGSTLSKVGGFNPLFFHYGEDENYVDRLRYHGKKIGVAPGVTVYHDREDDAKMIDEQGNRESMVNVFLVNNLKPGRIFAANFSVNMRKLTVMALEKLWVNHSWSKFRNILWVRSRMRKFHKEMKKYHEKSRAEAPTFLEGSAYGE